tara:strand:- start:17 stop:955 length:939 start_codon:yes stop_codon:yes gene_type:complete
VESCRDCHEAEVDAWERTTHATSIEKVIASELTQRLAEGMHLQPDGVVSHASCVRCHFTEESLASSVQITAGVSCESCHGGARDWIDEHNRKSLTRGERVQISRDRGMVHPSSLVDVAKGCFECHVVDDEQLVNRGGHPAMSDDFELYSWYSGEVRHGFLIQNSEKSVKSHTEELQPIPEARKRMMFVCGKLLHLGHTLRALALCSDPPVDKSGLPIRLKSGAYTMGVQHAMTARSLISDLERIQSMVEIPQINTALGVVAGLSFITGEQPAMAAASRELLRLADEFEKTVQGDDVRSIDSLIPAARRNRGH